MSTAAQQQQQRLGRGRRWRWRWPRKLNCGTAAWPGSTTTADHHDDRTPTFDFFEPNDGDTNRSRSTTATAQQQQLQQHQQQQWRLFAVRRGWLHHAAAENDVRVASVPAHPPNFPSYPLVPLHQGWVVSTAAKHSAPRILPAVCCRVGCALVPPDCGAVVPGERLC